MVHVAAPRNRGYVLDRGLVGIAWRGGLFSTDQCRKAAAIVVFLALCPSSNTEHGGTQACRKERSCDGARESLSSLTDMRVFPHFLSLIFCPVFQDLGKVSQLTETATQGHRNATVKSSAFAQRS